jgi:hypothetical protein
MDPTSPPPERSLIDEVLRRVGRNLLLFQQIEMMLKALLSSTGVAGYASEITPKAAQRAKDVAVKTLGQLAQQYHDEILGRDDRESSGPSDLKEPWFNYGFAIEADDAVIERDKVVLDALVTERNDLAHTFLTRWKASSSASTQEALGYLDAQRERAIPVRDRLKSALEALNEGRRQTAEYLMSNEGSRRFELVWLQQSRVVQLFVQIAETASRPDGWTVLARAGQLVHDLAGDEVNSAKDTHGRGSLKRLLVASELFEVLEEAVGDGKTRTVYRVKPPDANR